MLAKVRIDPGYHRRTHVCVLRSRQKLGENPFGAFTIIRHRVHGSEKRMHQVQIRTELDATPGVDQCIVVIAACGIRKGHRQQPKKRSVVAVEGTLAFTNCLVVAASMIGYERGDAVGGR